MKKIVLALLLLVFVSGCFNKSPLNVHKKFFKYTFGEYKVSKEKHYRCSSTGKKDCIKYTIKYKDVDNKNREFVFDNDKDNIHIKAFNYMTSNILNDVRLKIISPYFNVSEKSPSQTNDIGPSSIYIYAPTNIDKLKDKILDTSKGIKLSDYKNRDFFTKNNLYFALNISSNEKFLRNELDLYLAAIVSDLNNYMGFKINMLVSVYDENYIDNGIVSYKFFVNGQAKEIKFDEKDNVYKIFENEIKN